MIKINRKNVSRIPINGKETLRIMKNGQQLWSGTGLPAGYTLLEYIESTGQQYIDTGFKPNQDTRVVLSAYNNSTSSGWTFGTWVSASSNQYAFSCLSTYSFRYGTKSVSLTTVPVGKLEVDFNKNNYNMNGNSGMLSEQTFSCPHTIYLFAINANGSVSSGKFIGKIYSCKIYDDGELVRDYIPCMNANGVCGLFDKVNREFYQSGSSTPFTGDYFKKVEYIESTGSEYIDTGFKSNNNTRFVIDSLLTSNSNEWNCIFGARESDLSKCYSMFASGNSHATNPNQFYTNVGGKSYTNFITSYSPLERHVIDNNKNVVRIDGDIVYTHTAMTFQNTINAYIFAVNGGGTVGMQSLMRVYSCQIYDNGVLVRDFIPVKGMVSGTYGLYDKVNKKFYGSASATGFIGA